MNALKQQPKRFTCVAMGGYAVWTPEEMDLFGEAYLPEFHPSEYGEHLIWLWNRILEQSWFFPWFATDEDHRLSVAHDDPAKVDAVVRDMLDSGNAYRAGYGAVLRAPRDIPEAHTDCSPVLITAYEGDPLQEHIDRLGEMPAGWAGRKVATPDEHQGVSLAFLQAAQHPEAMALPDADGAGFIHISKAGFDGLIHWRGKVDAERFVIHAPGGSCEAFDDPQAIAIDLPGHGLSDDWWDAGDAGVDAWVAIAVAALRQLGGAPKIVVGQRASFLLACRIGAALGIPAGGFDVHLPAATMPDRANDELPAIEPDRHGAYLGRAWNIVRARHFFWPWFEAQAANAIPFKPEDIAPAALAREHRELIRARQGRVLLDGLLGLDHAQTLAAAPSIDWLRMDRWAESRDDIWKPDTTIEWRD